MQREDRRYTIRRDDDRALNEEILRLEEILRFDAVRTFDITSVDPQAIRLHALQRALKAEIAELKKIAAFHGGYDDRTYTIND